MTVISAPRPRKGSRIGHRLLGVAVIAGWLLMPLMPVLALAITWFSGLS